MLGLKLFPLGTMYLHLFNKITDTMERLRVALDSGDEAAIGRAALRVYAELTRAQCETEEMFLSQDR